MHYMHYIHYTHYAHYIHYIHYIDYIRYICYIEYITLYYMCVILKVVNEGASNWSPHLYLRVDVLSVVVISKVRTVVAVTAEGAKLQHVVKVCYVTA